MIGRGGGQSGRCEGEKREERRGGRKCTRDGINCVKVKSTHMEGVVLLMEVNDLFQVMKAYQALRSG